MQASACVRELAARYGYGDLPIGACLEWIQRPADRLGLKAQAEWYVRDCLLAHAYGSPLMIIGIIMDQGNGYYQSAWGGGCGLFTRYPQLNPRPAYTALATMTRLLDKGKFVRVLPANSDGVYAAPVSTPPPEPSMRSGRTAGNAT